MPVMARFLFVLWTPLILQASATRHVASQGHSNSAKVGLDQATSDAEVQGLAALNTAAFAAQLEELLKWPAADCSNKVKLHRYHSITVDAERYKKMVAVKKTKGAKCMLFKENKDKILLLGSLAFWQTEVLAASTLEQEGSLCCKPKDVLPDPSAGPTITSATAAITFSCQTETTCGDGKDFVAAPDQDECKRQAKGRCSSSDASWQPPADGMRLVKIGVDEFLAAPKEADVMAALAAKFPLATPTVTPPTVTPVTVTLVFEGGFDTRGCWGDLQVLQTPGIEGKQVCHNDYLQEFLNAMKSAPRLVGANSTGKSEDQVFTDFPGYIIKSVSQRTSYDVIPEVTSAVFAGKDTPARKDGRCWSTALAPICAALLDTDGMPWLVQRKVEYPGQSMEMTAGGVKTSSFDLKSPYFADSSRDFKAQNQFWSAAKHKKDTGFFEQFPIGLTVAGCTAREAAYILTQDSKLLLDRQATDYSILTKYYFNPTGDVCGCPSSAPTFPIMVSYSSTGWNVEGTYDHQVVFGIIDYLDLKPAAGWKSGSTKKQPAEYRNWWGAMWGYYFHISPMSIMPDGQFADPGSEWYGVTWYPSLKAEKWTINQKVIAVTFARWSNQCDAMQAVDALLPNYKGPKYCKLMNQYTSKGEPVPLSKEVHVYPGDEGKVVGILAVFGGSRDGPALAVVWDKKPDAVFRVPSMAIMGVPRVQIEAPPVALNPIITASDSAGLEVGVLALPQVDNYAAVPNSHNYKKRPEPDASAGHHITLMALLGGAWMV